MYLDQDLFAGGFRPAIDVRRSVSRIGGQAQHPRIKEEAGRMKLDYLQFLELEVFSRFGARLEASMEKAIRRGNALREILKQDRLLPQSVEFHMAWLIAFNDGRFDDIEIASIATVLESIEKQLQQASIELDDPRDSWSQMVSSWVSALIEADGQ